MNKGILVLSFDDGSAEHYRLFKILEKNNFPATFNIITSRIGEEHQLTREQLQEISAHPLMEIACHSHTHQNDECDILTCKTLLQKWFGLPNNPIGFASPGSKMKRAYVMENEKHLRALGLLYVRSSENPDPSPRHLTLQNRYMDAPKFITHNIPQLIYDFDKLFVPSAVIYHNTPVDDIKALIDIVANEKVCLVLMFHHIKQKAEYNYEDLWNYDFDQMQNLLEYISDKRMEGVLDIMTTKDAFLQ